jgi:hypothetical protein
MTDIQHNEELEIQIAQLIPLFIENLGNHKVRNIRLISSLGSSKKVDPQVHSYVCQTVEEIRIRSSPHYLKRT